ncbi:MAG: hypothetical protein M3442_03940 [Chloroflexota bacterium]|nr:hypothetical protein [Chloroflexota bacterium]
MGIDCYGRQPLALDAEVRLVIEKTPPDSDVDAGCLRRIGVPLEHGLGGLDALEARHKGQIPLPSDLAHVRHEADGEVILLIPKPLEVVSSPVLERLHHQREDRGLNGRDDLPSQRLR